MFHSLGLLASLLTREERKIAALIVALMLAAGIIEVIGVASVVPLIAIVSDPSIIQTNDLLRGIYQGLGFREALPFLVFISGALLCVILVRTIVMAGTQYAMVRFANFETHSISRRLLEAYVARPYSWYLDKNTADLSRGVLAEVDEIAKTAVMPALLVAKSTVVGLLLFALVIFANPLVAVVAGTTMGGVYGLLYLWIRRATAHLGAMRLNGNQERFLAVQEIFDGIKTIKASDTEEPFLARFRRSSKSVAHYRTVSVISQQLPRYLLEFIALGGVVCLLLLLLHMKDGRLVDTLPLIGMYGLASMRLLPVVNEFFQSLTSLRHSKAAVDFVIQDLQLILSASPIVAASELPLQNKIEFRDVSLVYPGADTPAVRDLNFSIRANSAVGIVGQTGAGKSSVLDMLLGLLEPSSGSIEIDGINLTRENAAAWRKSLAYVPQSIFLTDSTVAANIALGVPSTEIDMDRVEHASRLADLHQHIAGLTEGYSTRVGEGGVRFSGGQRQRIAIARALYRRPSVLIFDEGTSALDNETERSVMDAVFRLSHQMTIIIVAHRLTSISGCDSVVRLHKGRLVDSAPYQEMVVQTDDGPMLRPSPEV